MEVLKLLNQYTVQLCYFYTDGCEQRSTCCQDNAIYCCENPFVLHFSDLTFQIYTIFKMTQTAGFFYFIDNRKQNKHKNFPNKPEGKKRLLGGSCSWG